jgi:hypothetical protein
VPPAPRLTYIGRDNQLHIRVPRIEGDAAKATLDGVLDEAVWRQAALLTGFSHSRRSTVFPPPIRRTC